MHNHWNQLNNFLNPLCITLAILNLRVCFEKKNTIRSSKFTVTKKIRNYMKLCVLWVIHVRFRSTKSYGFEKKRRHFFYLFWKHSHLKNRVFCDIEFRLVEDITVVLWIWGFIKACAFIMDLISAPYFFMVTARIRVIFLHGYCKNQSCVL